MIPTHNAWSSGNSPVTGLLLLLSLLLFVYTNPILWGEEKFNLQFLKHVYSFCIKKQVKNVVKDGSSK